MKTETRHIVVKALLNASEFLEFDRACKQSDVAHSAKLRELANGWSARQHDRPRTRRSEWPVAGHSRAMLLPGRVRTGADRLMNMRM
jgi:hypothetical protein